MKQRLDFSFEKIHASGSRQRPQRQGSLHAYQKSESYQRQVGFVCLNCGHAVPSQELYSGVNNRNHCPYCLFSRHVDLFQAGDRLSACRAPMQAIGLTFKKERKKYGSKLGELMLIHQCAGCQTIAINRIAADDDSERMLGLMVIGPDLPQDVQRCIQADGIVVVGDDQLDLVKTRLFGKGV